MNQPTKKVKGPVTLRYKVLADGSKSLYLDIYWNGKRHYEFLKMYLNTKGNTQEVKDMNQATLKAANTIVAERTQQLVLGKAGIIEPSKDEPAKQTLDEWLELCEKDAFELAQSKNRTQFQNSKSYKRIRQLVKHFHTEVLKLRKSVSLEQVDKSFLVQFCQWLDTVKSTKNGKLLSANTKHFYFLVLSSAINKAYKKGQISTNPIYQLDKKDKPHKTTEKREYLTIEELRQLFKQPGNQKIIHSFLFSCLCGLRLSDIATLTWKDLHMVNNQWVIEKKQIKTQEIIYLPINQEALQFLPPKTGDNDRIFPIRTDNGYISKYISNWVKNAGIQKHITFHCARHTFATTLLTLGADIYTTSKLLGHKDIATTQIYANIVNSKKNEAMNLMEGLFKSKD